MIPTATDSTLRRHAVRGLAQVLYRDLRADGCDDRQVITLAAELIGEVTAHLASTATQARES